MLPGSTQNKTLAAGEKKEKLKYFDLFFRARYKRRYQMNFHSGHLFIDAYE